MKELTTSALPFSSADETIGVSMVPVLRTGTNAVIRSTRRIPLATAFAQADVCLRGGGSIPARLRQLIRIFRTVERSSIPPAQREDLDFAVDAMVKASHDDYSGVAQQYLRLVQTTVKTAQSDRIIFTVWNRTGERHTEPCVLQVRVNARNLALLGISRSRAFVERVVERLGAGSYPEAILSSRMQGLEVMAGAGVRPHVLFADFVQMGQHSGIDPATAGGLLFDSFGDSFLDDMRLVRTAFPNVAAWLEERSLCEKATIRLLTTGHVQAHDLCGHSVPYDLKDPTRVKADWFLRSPLEEMYADAQAMWIYSAPSTRCLLRGVLSDDELDALPLIIAMKRLTFYAMKDVEDHDARCAWMLFGYWRKAGLIHRAKGNGHFFFDIKIVPDVMNQLLTDLLHVERQISNGVEAYEAACREFSQRFGYENPLTKKWEIPDDLGNMLFD